MPAGGVVAPLNAYNVQVRNTGYTFNSTGAPQILSARARGMVRPPCAPAADCSAWRWRPAVDYTFGENLNYNPRANDEVQFWMLRNLADSLPLLRIVMEKRKDLIAGWR